MRYREGNKEKITYEQKKLQVLLKRISRVEKTIKRKGKANDWLELREL